MATPAGDSRFGRNSLTLLRFVGRSPRRVAGHLDDPGEAGVGLPSGVGSERKLLPRAEIEFSCAREA
jgi:hypothetical protein